MLLPALSQAKGKAMRIKAINNLKQLQQAYMMYVAANQGKLPASGRHNDHEPGSVEAGLRPPDWTGGQWLNLPVENREEVDPYAPFDSISSSPLWKYCGEQPELWHDPGDRTTGSHPEYRSGARVPRVRSYSMNSWMGGPYWHYGRSRLDWRVFF